MGARGRGSYGRTTGVVGAGQRYLSIVVSRCHEIVSSTVDGGDGEVHAKSVAVDVEVVLLILGLFAVEESLFALRSSRNESYRSAGKWPSSEEAALSSALSWKRPAVSVRSSRIVALATRRREGPQTARRWRRSTVPM